MADLMNKGLFYIRSVFSLIRGRRLTIIPVLHKRHAKKGIKSTVRLFADDTTAYFTISSNSDASDLQSDLDKLAAWETTWKMSFHPDKFNVLTISRKKNPIKASHTLHGHTLSSVFIAKYL
jgi:hypothetical protein